MDRLEDTCTQIEDGATHDSMTHERSGGRETIRGGGFKCFQKSLCRTASPISRSPKVWKMVGSEIGNANHHELVHPLMAVFPFPQVDLAKQIVLENSAVSCGDFNDELLEIRKSLGKKKMRMTAVGC